MLFSLATIPKVVILEVVYYSSINHSHHFKTHINQFPKSIIILKTSKNTRYHQEIQFLMELQQGNIMIIGFISYFRFFCKIILQYMLKNNMQTFFYPFIHWKLQNSYVLLELLHKKQTKHIAFLVYRNNY